MVKPEPVVSRRVLLAGMGGTSMFWTPIGRVLGDAGCVTPPDFPASIPLYRRAYQNWAGETRADDVWTCEPGSPGDVVALAGWAHAHGYVLRPQGFRHGWAPLTITAGTGCDSRVLLIDLPARLTAMSMVDGSSVRVQAGASMEALLGFLEDEGYGLTATPAPGDLSVGGALAIGAHGTAVPAAGEARAPGTTYGSLSNLVTSVTAVVWDAAAGRYALRTFDRDEPGSAALLTHLGRGFVVEVTLRVGANRNLRCLSRIDIAATALFAEPGTTEDTFQSFLIEAGRVEAIWFPFTTHPWLKVWSVAPDRPPTSRRVLGPYNYPFSDNVPKPVADLAGAIASGQYYLAPALGQAQYAAALAGLTATFSADIWGPSKNVLLYVRPSTLRMHANGYAVLVRRADVQWVVHTFAAEYQRLLTEYAGQGRFPVNGAVEIRATGLDEPSDVEVAGAVAPLLSATTPDPANPEWDTAVWLDVLTLPGTAHANAFYRDLERFLFAAFTGSRAAVRVEWSKGWAYTDEAAWADPDLLGGAIPASFGASWRTAVSTLDRYDPHRIFSNTFLDGLLD
jgi:FAD/FMN-containing dehydrogenase